jgi:hypothetical protein
MYVVLVVDIQRRGLGLGVRVVDVFSISSVAAMGEAGERGEDRGEFDIY